MKRMLFSGTVPMALLLAFVLPAGAQEGGLAVEARGAYGFPVGDFSDDLLAESDFGFGVGAMFALTPGFGVYGGWARDRFDCEICGSGDEIRVSGFEGGLTFLFDRAGLVPWIKAGLLAHETEVRIAGLTTDTGRNLGFQGVLGADIPLGETMSIAPAVRYNHIPSDFELFDFEFENELLDIDIQYLSIDLGIRVHTRRGP